MSICMICGKNQKAHFSKNFNLPHLGVVDYIICENCGFVISKTHQEMPAEQWNKINQEPHSYTKTVSFDLNWEFRIQKQAEIIKELYDFRLLSSKNNWVDYGCGNGELSTLVSNLCGVKVMNFDLDPCKSADIEYLSEEQLLKQKYDFVIATSVLEHLTRYSDLDKIFNLVSDTGTIGIHTFVSNTVPSDPNWFYLLPAHCAFHTNKSMQILFDRYGFVFSIYNLESKMWFLFKNINNEAIETLNSINEKEKNKYHFKFGFIDYWQ